MRSRKSFQRLSIWFSLLVVLAMALASCSPAATQTQDAPTQPAAVEPTAAAEPAAEPTATTAADEPTTEGTAAEEPTAGAEGTPQAFPTSSVGQDLDLGNLSPSIPAPTEPVTISFAMSESNEPGIVSPFS